ncbi:MAG: hypothetical protein COT26_00250, partial [Candidatus Kerfeldbacteria bacterium CG08_land_8_20_14_0_20_43_14]
GIWFDGSNIDTLTDSTIESSSFDGIRLSSSSDNIITNNVILNNSLGISFGPPTNSTNKIYNNNFVNNSTQIFIGVNDSGSNVFNLATPTGGNYWSNYDTPAEGCNDTNNDGFCDLPFFTGGPGKDNLPWTKKDGWLAPLNNPPTLSFPETGLYAGDGIDPNAGDTSTQFTFKVIYTDADNDPPSFINTFLFGHATTTIPMSVDTTAESALHDGNYANGEQYVSFWKREVVGLHYYTSEASDGSSAVRFPELPNVAGFPLEIKKPFTHKVALIPVRYIGEPSPFHSIGELKGKAVSVNEYYNQQSYGAVNIDIQFASDEWLLLDKRLEDYTETSNWWEKWERIREDAIQLSGINVDDYDAVIVIQPACMRSFANEIGGKKIITTEKDPYGVWAHELGHTSLFKFYDYYEETDYALSHGEIGNWGLMGRATLMNPTSPIMSANKVKAGWLQFNTISADGYGLYDIDFLTGLNSGGQANRYATKGGNTSYYIFEGRGPVDNVSEDYLMPSDGYCGWPYDYKLSEDKGVQLYKVTRGVNQLSGEPKIYSVPHPIMFLPDSWNKVTLTPSKSYIDEEAEVKFTAIEENGQFKIKITNFTPVKKKIISLINIFFESTLPSVIPEPLIAEENFDFDLHVSTPDGKMVGMDYQTQNYINQIEGVTTSGNIPGGGPEWISVPDDTFVYYTIDTTPAQKWSAETGVSIGKIFTTWQVITYDGLGQRQESSPIATEIELGAESALALKAEVNIDPSTINLNSSGKWITAYIELPQPYDVRKIKLDTVFLNRFIIAEQDQKYGFVKKPEVIDHDKDGIPELVVKFDRGRVIKMIGESSDQKRNTTRQQLELSGEVFYNQVPIPFSGEYQVVIKRSNP